jgi:hypothetical protein
VQSTTHITTLQLNEDLDKGLGLDDSNAREPSESGCDYAVSTTKISTCGSIDDDVSSAGGDVGIDVDGPRLQTSAPANAGVSPREMMYGRRLPQMTPLQVLNKDGSRKSEMRKSEMRGGGGGDFSPGGGASNFSAAEAEAASAVVLAKRLSRSRLATLGRKSALHRSRSRSKSRARAAAEMDLSSTVSSSDSDAETTGGTVK